MQSIHVLNLETGDLVATFSPATTSLRQAAISTFAATIPDGCNWEYERRYGHRVLTGRYTVACGAFAAILVETCQLTGRTTPVISAEGVRHVA